MASSQRPQEITRRGSRTQPASLGPKPLFTWCVSVAFAVVINQRPRTLRLICFIRPLFPTCLQPAPTPKQKVRATQRWGGDAVEVRLTGDTFDAAAEAARAFVQQTGAVYVPPFDDPRVIEGQGTVGVEIMGDLPDVDVVLMPNGGGGLCAGVGSFIKALAPHVEVIGVEPEGAPSMTAALKAGGPVALPTIDRFVDGAAVKRVGDLTYALCARVLDDMLLVSEGAACSTILQLYQEEAIVVEPAGALSIAALEQCRERIRGKKVVCVVSGSNNDLDRLAEIKERALQWQGLKHHFLISFAQRPGECPAAW